MRIWLIGKILLHPLRSVQARIDAWVLARVRREAGPVVISRRRVYIVPSRYGYIFAVLLLAMLLGSMNYSNSLGFLLTFLLAGVGLVAMHLTHANLVSLRLCVGELEPVFAGEVARFPVRLSNRAPSARYAVTLSWPHAEPSGDTVDVGQQSEALAELRKPAPQRGWLPAGIFSVSTEFPLGLFHAWTWIELEMRSLVYPQPAPPGRAMPAGYGHGGHGSSARSGQEEFAGLRPYQRGDTARMVHWKSLPKLASPMVKQFADSSDEQLWLDWDALGALDTEERLSQLTRWVLDADNGSLAYGLHLPALRLAPDSGPAHRQRCLQALALFGGA